MPEGGKDVFLHVRQRNEERGKAGRTAPETLLCTSTLPPLVLFQVFEATNLTF